jgi:hypothetical protein
MDHWAWQHLSDWLEIRVGMREGALLCIVDGPTEGRRGPRDPWRRLPYHPHIQHANLGITSIYLQGIDSSEIIDTVHRRPAPMLPASAGLR